MNITLTITGGTAAEIQQAVQDLSNTFAIGVKGELLEVKATDPVKKVKAASLPPATVTEAVIKPVSNPTPEPENTTKVTASATIATAITIEEVRAAANEIAESGKRAEVKALISSFDGAKNINALAEQHYSAFIEKLKTL